MLKTYFLICVLFYSGMGLGQRTYRASSVLASGNWFKISIKKTGVYKVDFALLKLLGLNSSDIPSESIRLFGNGGQILPEACSANVADDLQENAIEMVDGGDGVMNSGDYFLFYAAGPDSWLKDSVNKRFIHRKNLYSDQSFYFITIGGVGKRINTINISSSPDLTITSYNDRYFYELDSINFLSSGKEWYGEEFSPGAGKPSTRSFAIPITSLILDSATLVSNCISRSINGISSFLVNINNTPVIKHDFAPIGTSNLDVFAKSSLLSARFIPSSPLAVTYNYQSSGSGAQGWLDWFELFLRRDLSLNGMNQLVFRDWNSIKSGITGEFIIKGVNSGTRVWDVTAAYSPLKIKTILAGTELKFVNDCNFLHEYVAFNNTGFLIPDVVGKIENQDLHNSSQADLLIITHSSIIEAARKLAAHHVQKDKMTVKIVTVSQVYNEFASGSPDPTGLRNFIKMYHDKAKNDTTKRPAYLLLFGDASFDYKNRSKNNTNLVASYQSQLSLDPLATYTSDDYFGFLDDHEDINSSLLINILDIGIGRVPAKNIEEAHSYVDKVINYSDPKTFGAWRNHLTFIADDEDFNLHVHDAEIVAGTASMANPLFLQNKLYLDAYRQESNSSGSRYPEVNQAITNQIQMGTLIWNYNGHGSFRRLAEEVVLDQDIVNSWNNPERLPLFITSTCDFAPYDNPNTNSLGENILLRQKTGAIALMTTTRLVFAFSNRIMNRNYLEIALKQKSDGSYLSLGEAVRQAKNITYLSAGDIINNRKFTLLGDPALTLAFPKYNIQTKAINDIPVAGNSDTLHALQQYIVSGSIIDYKGNILNNFNGTVYSTVFDKVQIYTTLSNDPQSLKENFEEQRNILFKGKSAVQNGNFSFSFIVPKDINYQFGKGKISYYAQNGLEDANGSFANFYVGGSKQISTDNKGPDIKAFLNDEKFTDGSFAGQSPVLMLKLSDSSGINIVGTGIGHDITAILDSNLNKVFVLNKFFEAELNTHRQGTVHFQLPVIEEGLHTIKIKAWDVANNSNEAVIHFRVVKDRSFSILRVFNFPNPVNSKTTFRFEHNLPMQDVQVSINLFTSSGKLLKSIQRTINTGGNRSNDIQWDLKINGETTIKKGNYVYVLSVKTLNGIKAKKAGVLVIK